MARPKQNGKRVSAYISDELFEKLKTEAEKKGINLSTYIRIILHEHTGKEKG